MTSKGQKSLALGASVLVNGGFLLAVAGLAPQRTPPPVESLVFEVAMEMRPAVAKTAQTAAKLEASTSADTKPPEKSVKTSLSPSQTSSSPQPLEPMASPHVAPISGGTEPATAAPAAGLPAAMAPSAPTAVGGPSHKPFAPGEPTTAYAARLRHHIEQFKIYPPKAKRRRIEGEVVLSFQMDRQGRVLTSRIERGSGSADIDRAALIMLADAQPLPRPPDTLMGEVLSLSFATRFSLSD